MAKRKIEKHPLLALDRQQLHRTLFLSASPQLHIAPNTIAEGSAASATVWSVGAAPQHHGKADHRVHSVMVHQRQLMFPPPAAAIHGR